MTTTHRLFSQSSFLIVGLFWCLFLHAQAACPPGQVPYATGNNLNVCGPGPQQQQQQPVRWITKWGAIATDLTKGSVIGSGTNLNSEADAKQAALDDCHNRGGEASCKVEFTYRNGCAAMASGDDNHNFNSAANIAKASQAALKDCNKGDTNCRVYYTVCSFPEPIQ